MERGLITTPFGRRSLTRGMLANQFDAQEIDAGKSADKWKLFRNICEARTHLGVTDRALAVLNALLTFYPANALSAEAGLVVFPSNAQLSIRAHGMAGTTLRRHLAMLVDAGLLIRKDSPNGKRYARKDGAGDIQQAFGFSLAPLLARAAEIDRLAQQVITGRLELRLMRERLTLCRRDVAKLIAAALEEGIPGRWDDIHDQFRRLVLSAPRNPVLSDIAPIVDELEMLRDEIIIILENNIKTQKEDGNDDHIGQHIQNSKPHSTSELEPAVEKSRAESWVDVERPQHVGPSVIPKTFPLGMVLQSCPEIAMYGPGGGVANWRDLMLAAVVVRSTLGISPSAYQKACEIMGPENAATVIACILEKAAHINSAGGYLRDLTRRAGQGEFSIGPMLMALSRSNAHPSRRAG